MHNDGYTIIGQGKAHIVHYNIDIDAGDPQDVLIQVKEAWNDTQKILAITSEGIKQREIHQFLENVLKSTVTPVAPGMFFVFRSDKQRENYLYNIQKSRAEGSTSKDDILVYLALARFRSENVIKNLTQEIQDDIKIYLGNYLKAISLSKKLLFTTGNKEEIIDYCEDAPTGINDDESLYIHSSAVPELSPTLRIFIGMAGIFYGDIRQADIIKIHKKSIKISFYNYDDFNNNPLPELHSRIKIDLAKQQMSFYNHKSTKSQQLLYFKENYVLESHPAYKKWQSFSDTLKSNGVNDLNDYGPTKQELKKIISPEFLKEIV